MYNTTTTVKVTALTSDTLYHLAAILKGNRYATIETTEAEAKDIEQAAYVANMGASNREAAWIRFCELLTDGERYGFHSVSEELADRLSNSYQFDRYEVRTFDADGDTIDSELYYNTFEEAKAALLNCLNNDDDAVRGFVHDDAVMDGVYEVQKDYVFEVVFSSWEAVTVNNAEEAADAIAECLADRCEDEYDEMLDECYDVVTIGNLTYSPSEVLKKVDPIAYRCSMVDWTDGERSDALYTIERMDEGDEEQFIGGITVRMVRTLDVSYIAPSVKATAKNSLSR